MGNGAISIDYDNCLVQAGRLESIAVDCDNQAGEAANIAGRIENEWKGNSGTAMASRYREWEKRQRDTANNLREVARQIRTTADAIKAADEAAAARIEAEQMMQAGGAAVQGLGTQNVDAQWNGLSGAVQKGVDVASVGENIANKAKNFLFRR